jgi:hypothetical protein
MPKREVQRYAGSIHELNAHFVAATTPLGVATRLLVWQVLSQKYVRHADTPPIVS